MIEIEGDLEIDDEYQLSFLKNTWILGHVDFRTYAQE